VAHPATALRRELGVFSAAMLVVGGIIGSGIFFTPSETAQALPSAGWVLAVWAFGGVVAFAGALTYAELGALIPEAGGAYVYIREAFGGLPAFLYGWMSLLLIASGALAAVAMGFAGYVEHFVSIDAVGGRIAVAAITISVLALINYFGVKPGAIVQNIMTVAKVAALGALIVAAFVLWNRLASPLPVPNAPAPRASLLAGLGAAFVPVLFTIGGWQQMNMVAGEIRDPERNIPRALAVGIAIVVICYLGANAAYLRALGRDGLAASTAVAADSASRMLGPAGATFIAAAAMVSIFGFVNVTILANSRIVYAMSRDGLFFAAAGRVHPRYGSPHVAIAVMALWSLALLFLSRGDIGVLLSGVVFADWIFSGLGAASVFALRRSMPDSARPYRVPGYPLLPAFFVCAAIAGIVSSFYESFRMSLLGCAILVVGVIIYHRRPKRDTVAALVVLLAIPFAASACAASGDAARGDGGDSVASEAVPPAPYRVVDVSGSGTIVGRVSIASGARLDTTYLASDSAGSFCGPGRTVALLRGQGDHLSDVLVWLADAREGKELPVERRYELTNSDCSLEPRVQAAVVGGMLNVRNADRSAHRATFLRGTDTVVSVRETEAGQVVPTEKPLATVGLVAVRSDRYPWSRAWIRVFDHPYFAVTNRDGIFTIDSVPPGDYTLEMWEPRLGMREREVHVSAAGDAKLDITF
jgi:APA family basic amino acid/polyamine antiporter